MSSVATGYVANLAPTNRKLGRLLFYGLRLPIKQKHAFFVTLPLCRPLHRGSGGLVFPERSEAPTEYRTRKNIYHRKIT
jgi:hypothetical protein